MAAWIEIKRTDGMDPTAWIGCPECGSIVHLSDVHAPARASLSSPIRELRLLLECEHGHRSVIEMEDHSAAMVLSIVRLLSPGER